MARIPLVGGSYSTRSIIASAQRCINYYSEINPKSSIVPLTHYQRPGLVPRFTVGMGPIRGLYRASNGVGYVVSGSQIYRINGDNTTVLLGYISPGKTNPVSMIDNRNQIMLVDGSKNGWVADVNVTPAQEFKIIDDPTGAFTGADKVDYIDTFIVWNMPGYQSWASTGASFDFFKDSFDPSSIGIKAGYPDNVQTLIVNRREVFVLGDVKGEVWFDAGLVPFPFQPLPGMFIEHGIAAKYSLAAWGISVFWLAQDLQGNGIVLRMNGYTPNRISNHALEHAIGEMNKTVGIEDAIGMTYQKDGHTFYFLTFPKGDQTWVFDSTVQDPTAAWHQEGWTDNDGVLHRSRINCHAFINGMNLVGDHQYNTVYEMDLDTYTDTVGPSSDLAVEYPMTCVRSFPRLGQARMAGGGQMVETDGRRLQFSRFVADMESGMGAATIGNQPAKISLRWSDDRGRTFGNDVLQSSGMPGEYLTQPQWLGMGIARDRIFELSHTIAGPAALNGAWVDAEVLGT